MDNDEPPSNGDGREHSIIEIKTEPDLEELDSVEREPYTDPLLNAADGNETPDCDAEYESLGDLLQQYRSNVATQRQSSYDDEYQEAFNSVARKREELLAVKSLTGTTEADLSELHLDLCRLENDLQRIEKLNRKSQDYQSQELEDSNMFFSADDADDEEIEMTPAPSRAEALNMESPRNTEVLDEGDDAEDQPGSPSRKTKNQVRKAKKITTQNKRPSTKSNGQGIRKRQQTATRGRRGGHQGPNMINMSSLIRNDVVADAQANQGAGELPSFEGISSKQKALQSLIASIPVEQRDTMRGEKTALDKAARQFCWKGRGSMQVKDEGWQLKGMTCSLKSFQLLGAAWGCKREAGSRPPYGGMLADTMGYGKTIQTIAIMVENQPKPSKKNRTTLIVVPTSLVDQWVDEFVRHTEEGVMDKILPYTSRSRMQGAPAISALSNFQVVITTYSEVMNNYPKCTPPLHLTSEKAKDEWWDRHYNANKGPLLRMPFFRVILDEAHKIKNHESRTSKACRLLTAKYKWILSGTPLSNCMEELFSYFNFLGVDGAATYEQFKNNYAQRKDTTTQRLDAMLRKVMIRRTGANRLLGKPLVTLPALDHQTIQVEFNLVERAIYMIVRQRFINRINDWSISGKIGQLSRNIFVMLLRLRQMCAHVLMVSPVLRDVLESEDIEKLWKTIERKSQIGNDVGKRTATVLKKIFTAARDEREGSSTNASRVPSPATQERPIDLTFDNANMDFRAFFQRMLRDGTWDKVLARSRCHACKEIPEAAIKISIPCGHLYCEECLRPLLESAEASNVDATCCECQGPITSAADMKVLDYIAGQTGNQRKITPENDQKKAKEKEKKEKKLETAWLNTPGVEFLSTKVQAVVATLEEWIKKDPHAKTVVFTLFLPIIRLLAKVCTRKGWGYQKYTGDMNVATRDRALKKWKDPDEGDKVLLMSMRAGGLGLNLIEASYAVIVDPWWNEPAEDQAFSRVYRIGQKRDCVVRRFVIKDAIDTQLMLHLQKLKAQECDRVIDGRNQSKLDAHDLIKLFGPTRRDPETNETIIVDDRRDGSFDVDDFVMGDEQIVIDNSETEEVSAAPRRPQE